VSVDVSYFIVYGIEFTREELKLIGFDDDEYLESRIDYINERDYQTGIIFNENGKVVIGHVVWHAYNDHFGVPTSCDDMVLDISYNTEKEEYISKFIERFPEYPNLLDGDWKLMVFTQYR
jgi:hypothetical protein